MKTLLLLALCSGCLCLMASGSLLNFADMIKKASGHNAVGYAAYGCHCGWGGKGKTLDAIDRCCHVHGCCYDRAVSKKCDPKKNKYTFKVANGKVTCGGTRCGKMACECDKAAALCFKANRKSYNVKHAAYPNFLCKGSKPGC